MEPWLGHGSGVRYNYEVSCGVAVPCIIEVRKDSLPENRVVGSESVAVRDVGGRTRKFCQQ